MIIGISIAILVFLINVSAQSDVGDACTDKLTGSQGECVLINNCATVVQAVASDNFEHSRCGFSGSTPIVCCPSASQGQTTPSTSIIMKSSLPDRVSVRKCNEYKEAVNERVQTITPVGMEESTEPKCVVASVMHIVGGTEAIPNEFPHIALIGRQRDNGIFGWVCGGTLISEDFVLTAAHCVLTERLQKVRLGAHDLTKVGTTDDRTVEYGVAQIIIHPEYVNSKPPINDIALLRLSEKVQLTPYIRPACLPTEFAISKSRCIACGWGKVLWKSTRSNVLLKVTLDLFTQDQCNVTFSINHKHICAGSFTEEKDTCQGDSGGPLQLFHPTHFCTYTVVGVTSYGIKCAAIGIPAVYTRVFEFLPWIEQMVWPTA